MQPGGGGVGEPGGTEHDGGRPALARNTFTLKADVVLPTFDTVRTYVAPVWPRKKLPVCVFATTRRPLVCLRGALETIAGSGSRSAGRPRGHAHLNA